MWDTQSQDREDMTITNQLLTKVKLVLTPTTRVKLGIGEKGDLLSSPSLPMTRVGDL